MLFCKLTQVKLIFIRAGSILRVGREGERERGREGRILTHRSFLLFAKKNMRNAWQF